MRIREGDPLEIYTDREGEIILKKYSPIRGLDEYAKECADAVHHASGYAVCICDKDNVIAVSGGTKKDYIDKPVSGDLDTLMKERGRLTANRADNQSPIPIVAGDQENQYTAIAAVPVLSSGDVIGCVVLFSREQGVKFGQTELKLADAAAGFVGRQIEQ